MVRYPEEIERIDGLILPGGESTVQSTLAAIQRSLPVIKKRISEGMPGAWHMCWYDNAVQEGI